MKILPASRTQLLIILFLLLLISIIWVWYGLELKDLEHREREAMLFYSAVDSRPPIIDCQSDCRLPKADSSTIPVLS